VAGSDSVAGPLDLRDWLREQCSDFRFDVGGVFQRSSDVSWWPLQAAGPAELEERLVQGGHLLPLPKESREPRQTQSRITLYTGNTYFRWPDLHWPGTFRPFRDYATHLDVIMIYTLNPDSNARVEDLEIIVQEPWRIASREWSSTTREYIGAVTSIDALRSGAGAFATPAEFYDYWRRFPFKVSPQVQTQLQRLLKATHEELIQLRQRQQPELE
jgi:hypothetical protein